MANMRSDFISFCSKPREHRSASLRAGSAAVTPIVRRANQTCWTCLITDFSPQTPVDPRAPDRPEQPTSPTSINVADDDERTAQLADVAARFMNVIEAHALMWAFASAIARFAK